MARDAPARSHPFGCRASRELPPGEPSRGRETVIDDEHQEHDAETFAVLLLPGWRHPVTDKVHIRRECRAVQYHRERMTPILVRLDAESEAARVLGEENLCRFCFSGF